MSTTALIELDRKNEKYWSAEAERCAEVRSDLHPNGYAHGTKRGKRNAAAARNRHIAASQKMIRDAMRERTAGGNHTAKGMRAALEAAKDFGKWADDTNYTLRHGQLVAYDDDNIYKVDGYYKTRGGWAAPPNTLMVKVRRYIKNRMEFARTTTGVRA
jgi:hypothetical protein